MKSNTSGNVAMPVRFHSKSAERYVQGDRPKRDARWHLVVDSKDARHHQNARNRREIARWIEGGTRLKRRIDSHCAVGPPIERAAVGGRFCHSLGPHTPARTRNILDRTIRANLRQATRRWSRPFGCPGWPGIRRSQSSAGTLVMKASVSSGKKSIMPRPGNEPTGMVSTIKTIFSFGSRITRLESE